MGSSAFRPYNGEKINSPEFLDRKTFIEGIHQAQFKQVPANFKKLTSAEVEQINKDQTTSPYFPQQEKGSVRPAPYLTKCM